MKPGDLASWVDDLYIDTAYDMTSDVIVPVGMSSTRYLRPLVPAIVLAIFQEKYLYVLSPDQLGWIEPEYFGVDIHEHVSL